MDDLLRFADDPNFDTWWKSGRMPGPNDPPVTIPEHRAWLEFRIDRGDRFGIATDPALLSDTYVAGEPNGYFTWWELRLLQRR